MPQCNLCGTQVFQDFRRRPGVQCSSCRSLERTRIIKLYLDKHGFPKPGQRVLHLAPEPGLAALLGPVLGAGYDPVDLDPAGYPWAPTRKLDLVADCESIPSNTYDMVLHSHVMEHIPANITAVMYHLHRAVKPGGIHLMCVPILPGAYKEDLGPLPKGERTAQYGQSDHVRRFGADDLSLSLGMLFDLPDYDLEREFGAERLRDLNIPENLWRALTPSTVYALPKSALKLKPG